MKIFKSIFLIFSLFVMCFITSCDKRPVGKYNRNDVKETGCVIREFTVRGEVHEYLYYEHGYTNSIAAGMVHLPNCKYCEMQNPEGNPD